MNLLRLSSCPETPHGQADAPDFLAFLQTRLNVSPGAALHLLGDWLTHYSPKRVRAIRIIARKASAAPRARAKRARAPAPMSDIVG